MNDVLRIPLQRNPKGMHLQMIGIGIGFAIVFGLLIRLIRLPFQLLGSDFLTNTFALVFLYVVICAIGYLVMSSNFSNTKYFLQSNNVLVIAQKKAVLRSYSEDVIRLDTVLASGVSQSFLGRKFGYGDITLTIPKLNDTKSIVIKSIDKPVDQLTRIQEAVTNLQHSSGIGKVS